LLDQRAAAPAARHGPGGPRRKRLAKVVASD
jgi:hypothetical protein